MRLRNITDSSGAAIIEFAFVLPIFVYLTFAALQFSYIIIVSSILESAMFDATRVAKVSDNSQATIDAIRQTIQAQSMGVIDANEVLITTNLQENLALDWQNAQAEQCTTTAGVVIAGQFCPCASNAWLDVNDDDECDIGPPPIVLQAPGNLVNFMAFYKVQPFIPAFGFLAAADGKMYIVGTTTIRVEP